MILLRKRAVDFVVIGVGILLMVIRFNGGSDLLSYPGVILMLIGILAPLKSETCRYCKSDKPLDATACPHCGKTQGASLGAVILGVFLFAIWIFIEVCII